MENKGNKNAQDSNSHDSQSYYTDSQQSTYRDEHDDDEHDDEEENINTIQSQVSPVPIPGLISPTPTKEKILKQQAEIGIPGLISPSPVPRKKSSFNETIPTFSPKKSPHSSRNNSNNNSNNNSAMNSPSRNGQTIVKGLVIPPSPQSNSKAAWGNEPNSPGGFNTMVSPVPIPGLVSPTPNKEKKIKQQSPSRNVQFTNNKSDNEIIAQYSEEINSKSDQDYDDDSSRGDYWHGRFENLAIEKSRLEVLNNKMEVILQQSVIDQSKVTIKLKLFIILLIIILSISSKS
jgi:hypothetical protein